MVHDFSTQLLELVFGLLNGKSVAICSCVCKKWKAAANRPEVWEKASIGDFGSMSDGYRAAITDWKSHYRLRTRWRAANPQKQSMQDEFIEGMQPRMVKGKCNAIGNRYVAIAGEGFLQIHDLDARVKLLDSHRDLPYFRMDISAMCFRGSDVLLTGTEDGLLSGWCLKTGNRLFSSEPDGHPINAMGDAGEHGVVTGGCEFCVRKCDSDDVQLGYLRIWDTEQWVPHKLCISFHRSPVRCLCVASDPKLVASTSNDHEIRVNDIVTRKLVHTLQGHEHYIESLASKHGKLVSGCVDTTIRVWDLTSGKCLHVLRANHGPVPHIGFDGKKIVSAHVGSLAAIAPSGFALYGNDWDLKMWDVETGEQLRTFPEVSAEGIAVFSARLVGVESELFPHPIWWDFGLCD